MGYVGIAYIQLTLDASLAGSCGHINRPSSFIKCSKTYGQLSIKEFLKKDSAPMTQGEETTLNSTCECYYFDTNLTVYTYFFGVFMKTYNDMTYC
jgi:hypothetical protein